jgi:hypothetical protein
MTTRNTFARRFATATYCHLAWALIAAIVLLGAQPATAGVASGTGTGTITFDASAGGGPIDTVGPAAFGPYPGDLFFPGPSPPGAVLAQMAESWSFTLPEVAPFDVFLNHHAASGPSPLGDPFLFTATGTSFTSTLKGDFTVTLTLDAGGLGETLIPKISYPAVFWVGSSGMESFDETISYSDDFGALGSRTLSFHPPPGSTGLMPVTGFGALDLPPLPGGDHLTLTGSFLLSVNAFGGTGSEIKVMGIPEPSTGLLLISGAALTLLARWRRSRTR